LILRLFSSILICLILSVIGISSAFANSMDEMLLAGAKNIDLDMVKTAIANGANVNYVKEEHSFLYTAMGYAIGCDASINDNKREDIVTYLIACGADVNLRFSDVGSCEIIETPLTEAVKKKNIKIIKSLIQAGADVNSPSYCREPFLYVEENGNTPLLWAIDRRRLISNRPSLEIVKILIENNADVNQANKKGVTPLMCIANSDNFPYDANEERDINIPIARELLKAGADPTKLDNESKTAFQIAVDHRFKEMIYLLMPKKDVTDYINCGKDYANKGQYDLAIDEYNKAIELNPQELYAYLKRGDSYLKKSQYDLALSDYSKVIEIDPRDPRGYTMRGLLYVDKGQYALCVADLDKAIELDPKMIGAYYNKAIACVQMGRKDEAIKAFKLFLHYAPSNPSNDAFIEEGKKRIRELGGEI